MNIVLTVWLGYALLGWAADGAEAAPADARPQATATAPADDEPTPRGGQRRRLGEGPRRRDANPPLGPGQRRGERFRGGQPQGPEEPLPPEVVDEIMRFARDNFPQLHDRLDHLRRVDPREFQRILQRVHNRLRPMMELNKTNPKDAQKAIEEHRFQLRIADLAAQYRRAESEADRARLRTDLEKCIRERFERHQARSRQEIERLRKRLDEQERTLAERDRDKEKLLRDEFERTLKNPPPRPDRAPDSPRPDPEDPKPEPRR